MHLLKGHGPVSWRRSRSSPLLILARHQTDPASASQLTHGDKASPHFGDPVWQSVMPSARMGLTWPLVSRIIASMIRPAALSCAASVGIESAVVPE